MNALLALIYQLLDIYVLLVFIYVILSWLIAFNVINTRNKFVNIVQDFLARLIEPVTNQIRRILPDLGGLDISPIILILLVYFIQRLMVDTFGPQVTYL